MTRDSLGKSHCYKYSCKTFDLTGYDRVGFSIAYGPAGKDEEGSKDANLYVIHPSGSWPTSFAPQVLDVVYESGCTLGYRRRL